MVNFAGWDSKWNEWIKLSSRRVREVQCPDAPRIRKDGTPIFPKHRSKEKQDEAQPNPANNEAEPAPKLSREEQRELDRVKRKEKEEMLTKRRQEISEKRKNGSHKPPTEYQRFIKQELGNIMRQNPKLTSVKARKIAHERWKKSTVRSAGSRMGIVIGSLYQLYACLDEETPEDVAEKLKVDSAKLISINKSVYPDIRANTKLMEGTLLKLPARVGTGETVDVKIFAKVQSVKKTLTLTLKQNDRVSSIKKQIKGKEGIAVKELTVVFSGQRLDDSRTLADYNICNDSLVYVQVGSEVFENSVEEEIVEVEYDCGWMQTPSGQKFLASDDGQLWLQTSAGKLWTQQVKEREQQESAKNSGDGRQPKALNNFNNFMKEQVPFFRRIHVDMNHKTAWERAMQMWRVSFAPNTTSHRLEWGKLPSVVSWNLSARSVRWDQDGKGGEVDSAANASKKKSNTGNSGVAIPDEISDMVKSNQFNFSYDWTYREKHLSRTAKKAARISLTTDTIEMMTCELQGMDDRYDGSGWTTWKKRKTDAEEKKPKKVRVKGENEKNGAERKPRNSKSCPSNDVYGSSKTVNTNIPRWFKNVPRCPELLLPPCEETYVEEGKQRNREDLVENIQAEMSGEPVKSTGMAEQMQSEVVPALIPAVRNEGNAEAKQENDAMLNDHQQRQEQMEFEDHGTLMDATAPNEVKVEEAAHSSAVVGEGKREGLETSSKGEARENPDVLDSAPVLALEGGTTQCQTNLSIEQGAHTKEPLVSSLDTEGDSRTEGKENVAGNSDEEQERLESTCHVAQASGLCLLSGKMETTDSDMWKDTEGKERIEEVEEEQYAWIPLPEMPKADLEVSSHFFKLPYPAVKDMKQREFDDEACKDSTSEFPTPFTPISKNVYVGEERTALKSMESRSACQCIYVPGVPETACGEHSNCMLRDLYIECDYRCPCSSHCLNKRLQKRQWAKCSIFLAKNGRGWALRNDEDLRQGQLVMEYIGEVISGEEVSRRMEEYAGKRHTYMLKLNQEEFIDSTR